MKCPGSLPRILVLGTLLIGRAAASVIVYDSESDFLNAAPVISTETFDEFPSRTGFFTNRVVLDHVIYETDGPCLFEGAGNPCWMAGIHLGPASVTPPNDFGASFANGITEHRISFGPGNWVHAFGFWFLSGDHFSIPQWEVIITEMDGTRTVEPVEVFAGRRFLGFQSDAGIVGLVVRGALPGRASNWSYDNVSRGQVFPLGDSDGDGVSDDADLCPHSDLKATVVIGGCDSGVPNSLFPSGCTLSDLIATCAQGSGNHGQFVSCAASLADDLKRTGVITGRQAAAIQSCAEYPRIPDPSWDRARKP